MKQHTSQSLFQYWNDVRRNRLAPQRFDIEPSRISHILSETFILERGERDDFLFRLAGTRVCDQLGTELRGQDFMHFVGADQVAVGRVDADDHGPGRGRRARAGRQDR